MIVKGIEAYSIDKIVNNTIFSKDGTVSFIYHFELPPKYSLIEQDYDDICYTLNQAFTNFTQNSYIHKQDIVIKKAFDGSEIERNSFLGKDTQRHFNGRFFTKHYCLLCFTIKGLKSLEKAYLSNPFAYKEHLEENDFNTIEVFESKIIKACNILNNIKNTSIKPSTEEFIKSHLKFILNGFENSGFYDIDFRDNRIGNKSHFEFLSINRAEYFTEIKNIVNSKKSNNTQTVFEGFLEPLILDLDFNHIVNQMIYFEGKENIIKKIEEARKEYGHFQNQNESFKLKYNALDEVVKNYSDSDDDLVKTHINIMVLGEDKKDLNSNLKLTKEALDVLTISYYQPQKEILQNLFLGSVFGRQRLLHKDFYFPSTLLQAVSCFNHTSFQKDEEDGLYFNNRINQKPIKKKIWYDEEARNAIIVASTGGGKSVLMLTIMTQFIEKLINVVVAEFGRSFEFITKLYPNISKHIRLKQDTPLGINPFGIINGNKPSRDKKSYLTQIVMKTWREINYLTSTSVLVSMEKIIDHYYEEVKTGHCYEDFYHFVTNGGSGMLVALGIKEKYFDLDSFKHNCSDFITGGKYENVFKIIEDSTSDQIKNNQLVVFELTEIKKDPFLVTLILLILQDTIDSNILEDRGSKAVLIFDEFAETAPIKDMYTGEEVLQTVSVLNQKIRKENGAIYLIIQDFSQLPKSNYTDSIIANTQLFYVLPSNVSGYKKVEETLLLEKNEVQQMQSIKNDYTGTHKYSEFFLKRYENFEVLRNELSPATFLAYQTKGDLWKKLNDDFEKTKNLEISITNLLN